MKAYSTGILLFIVIILQLSPVLSKCGVALAESGERWEVDAKERGLGEKEIQQLREDKILIVDKSFRQVFDPYVGYGPQFITSDSLLNAFHVLYQESAARLEGINVQKLNMILPALLTNLNSSVEHFKVADSELLSAARKRDQIVIGSALKLMGHEKLGLEPDVTDIIEKEASFVVEAKVVRKPEWLGPSQDDFIAIDYSRYKPRGFYAKSERLSGYFRAISWLQSIPFRITQDEDLAAILLLGECLKETGYRIPSMRSLDCDNFFRIYSRFLGPRDDLDIVDAKESIRETFELNSNGLARVRADLLKGGRQSIINDQLSLPPTNADQFAQVSFRVISACRTPDAIMFQHTTRPQKFDRPFPSGLEVSISLGSHFARGKITSENIGILLGTIDEVSAHIPRSGLYCEYMECLRTLLDAPEPEAPEFMRNEAWQAKSCQTVLSGWAQMRHTWCLGAKENANWLCAAILPSGFVEPEPEFFAKMAGMVNQVESELKDAGAFEQDTVSVVQDLRKVAGILKKLEPYKAFTDEGNARLEKDEIRFMHSWMTDFDHEAGRIREGNEEIIITRTNKIGETIELVGFRERKSRYEDAIDNFNSMADRIERGAGAKDPDLIDFLRFREMSIDNRWRRLGDLCRRLEALSHKQLRGAPWNKEEQRFFMGEYGAQLGYIMFYEGNSYETPLDDAPRIIDVFSNPQLGEYLEVGVGRPQAIYVLYPSKMGEILCIGAVMPYYEFVSPGRMTDEEWKQLLDSDKRPAQPVWIKPFIGTQVKQK